MRTQRFVSALLLISILTGFVGCGGTDSADSTSVDSVTDGSTAVSESIETGRNGISDNLPQKDFGGAVFTILDRTKYAYEFEATEENGDILNDAVYKRNMTVEDRFNVDITTYTVDCLWGDQSTAFNNMLRSSIMAGDGAFDLVAGYAAAIPALVSDNIFMNWASLDYVDFTKPWWSEVVANELTINGKSFMVTGDISLALWEGMTCFFFNKQLAEDYNLGDIYATVESGDWTFDKLIEYTKNVYKDLDGDSVLSESDMYGLLCMRDTEIDNMKEAFELKVTEKDDDGFPELVFNNERTVEIVTKLNAYIHESGSVLFPATGGDTGREQLATAFSEGRGIFFTSTLGVSETLRAMDDDFGIIPYPKYNSGQTVYHSTSLDEFSLFLIPVDAKDPDMTAILTEALCAESYKQVIPVFYDTALKTKAARDEDSSAMIDIIRDGLIFDWGYLHSSSLGGVGHLFVNLIRNNNNNVASTYTASESTYKANLEKILEVYR